MSIAILLPSYNEEENIAQTIEAIEKIKSSATDGNTWQIYLADGGSTDKTREIAKEHGAIVLDFSERGKGRAIKYAFTNIDSDYLIIMDADISYPAAAIPQILEKLKNESCDVVIGSRFSGSIEQGAMKPLNSIGNQMLTIAGNILYKNKTSDLCSGMQGFTKKAYKNMNIDAPHFEVEANFFVEADKKGLKICEIPIDYKRRGGVSKLSFKHGIKIGLYLLKRKF
ncbi:MAG: glycosyltransferase family 2 protein [Candidatus Micrarchaeota archaeon]